MLVPAPHTSPPKKILFTAHFTPTANQHENFPADLPDFFPEAAALPPWPAGKGCGVVRSPATASKLTRVGGLAGASPLDLRNSRNFSRSDGGLSTVANCVSSWRSSSRSLEPLLEPLGDRSTSFAGGEPALAALPGGGGHCGAEQNCSSSLLATADCLACILASAISVRDGDDGDDACHLDDGSSSSPDRALPSRAERLLAGRPLAPPFCGLPPINPSSHDPPEARGAGLPHHEPPSGLPGSGGRLGFSSRAPRRGLTSSLPPRAALRAAASLSSIFSLRLMIMLRWDDGGFERLDKAGAAAMAFEALSSILLVPRPPPAFAAAASR